MYEIHCSGHVEPKTASTPDVAMDVARDLSKFGSLATIKRGTGLEGKVWAFARYSKIYKATECTSCKGAGRSSYSTKCYACDGNGAVAGVESP